jgi:hypothetical protein
MKTLKALRILLILVIINAISSGCSGGSTVNPTPVLEGKYNFIMYDSLEKKLLNGELTFSRNADSTYSTGFTIFNKYKDFQSYGNTQTSKIQTNYNNDLKKVFLNMNPSSQDDNLYITLDLRYNKLEGEWTHSTIAGDKGKGNFTAKKIK